MGHFPVRKLLVYQRVIHYPNIEHQETMVDVGDETTSLGP